MEAKLKEITERLAWDTEATHALIRAAMVIEAAREVVEIANRGLGVSLPDRFARSLDELESVLSN